MGMTYSVDGKTAETGTMNLTNLLPENIKAGVNINGVTGNYIPRLKKKILKLTPFHGRISNGETITVAELPRGVVSIAAKNHSICSSSGYKLAERFGTDNGFGEYNIGEINTSLFIGNSHADVYLLSMQKCFVSPPHSYRKDLTGTQLMMLSFSDYKYACNYRHNVYTKEDYWDYKFSNLYRSEEKEGYTSQFGSSQVQLIQEITSSPFRLYLRCKRFVNNDRQDFQEIASQALDESVFVSVSNEVEIIYIE